jgi:tetratricopeptide (TPR) repeat protein
VARSQFDAALREMARQDREGVWDAARCQEVAARFLDADDGRLAAPVYNAGLAQARCGRHEEAKALFRRALERDKGFLGARVALARYAGAGEELDRRVSGLRVRGSLDHAIEDMRRAVAESRYTSLDALTTLGELLMRRAAGSGAQGDMEEAKKSFQRALAIDDGYMPALNQLALHYLRAAKRAGGGQSASQTLDLAALVCSQALRKDPRYAPVYNTTGLIHAELGDFSRAAAAFDQARSLDPTFFEAQMNLAAVNMSFRSFSRAEEAYRAAIRLRSDDYDARLGLALALRGQIDDQNEPHHVAAVLRELAAAKALAPERPEAYYNEAVLIQEHGARTEDGARRTAALRAAQSLLSTFLAKAGTAPELEGGRQRAKERMRELDEILKFLSTPAEPTSERTGS